MRKSAANHPERRLVDDSPHADPIALERCGAVEGRHDDAVPTARRLQQSGRDPACEGAFRQVVSIGIGAVEVMATFGETTLQGLGHAVSVRRVAARVHVSGEQPVETGAGTLCLGKPICEYDRRSVSTSPVCECRPSV